MIQILQQKLKLARTQQWHIELLVNHYFTNSRYSKIHELYTQQLKHMFNIHGFITDYDYEHKFCRLNPYFSWEEDAPHRPEWLQTKVETITADIEDYVNSYEILCLDRVIELVDEETARQKYLQFEITIEIYSDCPCGCHNMPDISDIEECCE